MKNCKELIIGFSLSLILFFLLNFYGAGVIEYRHNEISERIQAGYGDFIKWELAKQHEKNTHTTYTTSSVNPN